MKKPKCPKCKTSKSVTLLNKNFSPLGILPFSVSACASLGGLFSFLKEENNTTTNVSNSIYKCNKCNQEFNE